MDADNPVVKLCVEGIQAEAENRLDDARALFTQAWDSHTDNFEACIAAHYLARHQESPQEMLFWNQEALNRAEAVADESVQGFYPSLYLNMGYSYEMLGDLEAAGKYYAMANERLDDLPSDPYGEVVRDAVARGRERIQSRNSSKE